MALCVENEGSGRQPSILRFFKKRKTDLRMSAETLAEERKNTTWASCELLHRQKRRGRAHAALF